MMTYERYEAECNVLATYFPANRFGFVWDDNPRLEVILPIRTKTEILGVYKVKIYGMDSFPEEEPVVTPGMILRDHTGKAMTEPSRVNHLLGKHNGETHLCIYASWDPKYSLNKTAHRTAVWLLAYHMHLKTGRSIESYLSHGA